ncbi:isoflavone reductase homolog isoform X2 [Phalaenopsis equestris]|uniref:isoflavone reductase homolog isoform X2 n=1 Tax=Phalaenopsis equestris TaxID=78828 RepID=UPI0009E4C29D|nr:isoflavone reductase homolog isoform X2 [Phalaenopsis equestris]
MALEKSRILIIGGTGFVGQYIVRASVRTGHPTFALIREGSAGSDPDKARVIDDFKAAGVTIVYGDLHDHASLVKAIKQVDVVISTVGHDQIADQPKIIAAIKDAGNVKRFLPAEFGNDVDNVHPVDAAKKLFDTKVQIRRIIEAENIPYTFVVANFTASYFLPSIGEAGPWSPPTEKVVIMGDGNAKVIFNCEDDIGTYTMKAIDDPRTLNKILYLRPAENVYSQNELISLWEKKTGKKLERIYVPETERLRSIESFRCLSITLHL